MPQIEVSREMRASPEEVWALVGDPIALQGVAVECESMAWVGTDAGPRLGARFRGRNRAGWRRWSTLCTIVEFEPGRAIAWDVTAGPLRVARWGYRIEPGPTPGTTTVTERFDDHRSALLAATSPFLRGTRDTEGHNRTNMTRTLEGIQARVESPA